MFCVVDDEMKDVPKHTQAPLYPTELLPIAFLLAPKRGSFAPFIAGSSAINEHLFAGQPDRTPLLRFLATHQTWTRHLLAQLSFFTVIDSYPIELLFPIRQGRSPQRVARKVKCLV